VALRINQTGIATKQVGSSAQDKAPEGLGSDGAAKRSSSLL